MLTAPPASSRLRHARRWGVVALVFVLLLGVGAGVLYWLNNRYVDQVGRLPQVFAPLDNATRPAPPATTTPASPSGAAAPASTGVAQTYLLLGSDLVNDGISRADTIMMVRMAADRLSAEAVSIPRDSWVDIPGYGMNKVNAAYAFGGPTLMVQTVERLTKVRIDHVLSVDFAGFAAMVDSVGGIEVTIAQQTVMEGYTFLAGRNFLDGEHALLYVRQRKNLPGGDFDRVQRQQNALRAFGKAAQTKGALSNPVEVNQLFSTIAASLRVDDGLTDTDLRALFDSMRYLPPDRVGFYTAPVTGTGDENGQSVVYLDPAPAATFWDRFVQLQVGAHSAEYKQLPDLVR